MLIGARSVGGAFGRDRRNPVDLLGICTWTTVSGYGTFLSCSVERQRQINRLQRCFRRSPPWPFVHRELDYADRREEMEVLVDRRVSTVKQILNGSDVLGVFFSNGLQHFKTLGC